MQKEIRLTKEELERIYKENTNKKAAKRLNVSIPTMIDIIKEAGIELKGRGGHNKKKKLKIIG